MSSLTAVLGDLIVIFFDLYIFTRVFVLRKDTPGRRLAMYGGCGVIVLSYFIVAYVMGMPPALASTICMTVPSFLLFLWLAKYRDSRYVLTFCFVDTISLMVGFVGRYVGLLTKYGEVGAVVVSALLFAGLTVIGIPYFGKYRKLTEEVSAGWRIMAVSTVLIYFALIFFAAYPSPLMTRLEYAPSWLVFATVVVSCYVAFIHSILKTKRISEQNKRLELEKEIFKIAFTDTLTGLSNRAAYVERLSQMERSRDKSRRICCVVFDLNGFKAINDTFGHHKGDQALAAAAQVLRDVFAADGEQLFRTGGDEFLAILPDADEAEVLMKVKCVRDGMELQGERLGLDLSIAAGYAFAAPDESIENAVIRADHAMYLDKRREVREG